MEYVRTGEKGDMIILTDEDGLKAQFEFLEMTVVEGKEYAVLLEQGDDNVTVMELIEDDDTERYLTIDDEDTFDTVCEALREEFGEEFEI